MFSGEDSKGGAVWYRGARYHGGGGRGGVGGGEGFH